MITLDNIRDQLRNRWAFALPVVDTIEARAKADTAYAADLLLWLAGARSTVHLRDNIMEPIRHLPHIIAIGKQFNPTTEWDNTWMPLDTAAHLAKLEATLPAPAFNCLPVGETLEDLCRRDHVCGFDLRFTKSMLDFRNYDQFGSDMQECNPSEATHATIYAMNDLGEAIAIHDAELTEAGADEVAATCRALFSAIVEPHDQDKTDLRAYTMAFLKFYGPNADGKYLNPIIKVDETTQASDEDAQDRHLLAMAREADAGHPAITSDELFSQIITAGALQEDDGEPD